MALIRCTQGHVFEHSSIACPTCGEAVASAPPPTDDDRPAETAAAGVAHDRQRNRWPSTDFGALQQYLLPGAAAAVVAVFVLLPALWPEPPLPGNSKRQTKMPDASTGTAVETKSGEATAKDTPRPAATGNGLDAASPLRDTTARSDVATHTSPPVEPNVPRAAENDGPSYAAFAAETRNALSPLARELLATSRGYFAFTRKEYSEARTWLTTKAARSNPAAMYWLGLMTEQGKGGPPDHRRALELITASATAGYPPAQTRLAEIYLRGDYPGVAKSRERARQWLVQVAKEAFPGTAKLIEEAGLTPEDIGTTMLDFGKLLSRSESEAYKIAVDLYRQNVGSARYWAGNLLLAGHGRGMSNAEAEVLIEDAARLYTTYAIDKLARLAAFGIGRDANPVEAAALGHLARINSASKGEIELIDKTLKPATRSLTDKQYLDLHVLLSGIVELPHRW